MITSIIEMSVLIEHDLKAHNDNYEKNRVINEISRMENKRSISFLLNFARSLNKNS